jgi:hypothetical protein
MSATTAAIPTAKTKLLRVDAIVKDQQYTV